MRPLWRDLIQSVWAVDPLKCPCCHGTLRRVESITRPEAIEFFLRLHSLREALVNIPPPPDPPYDMGASPKVAKSVPKEVEGVVFEGDVDCEHMGQTAWGPKLAATFQSVLKLTAG